MRVEEMGDIIKARRSFLKLSVSDLAELANVSVPTLKNIERGKANPGLNQIVKIYDILGLELITNIKYS